MRIKVDCYIRNKNKKVYSIIHLVLTEDDIFEMLHKQYDDGDIPLSIHLDRDEMTPEFMIDEITI